MSLAPPDVQTVSRPESSIKDGTGSVTPLEGEHADAPPAIALARTPTVFSSARVELEGDRLVFKPTWQFRLAFLALCSLALATAFDATTLPVALPTVSTELGGTALQAFWSGTSFLLASTSLQLSIASFSNIFGRKSLVFVSSALFFAGALVGALAGNFTVLLVGRTIQGVGGGGILALSEMVVADLVPLQFRGQWMSLFSAAWAIGTLFGPLIGAGFTQDATWRWIFYINLPIVFVGVVLVYFYLNQSAVPGKLAPKLKRFDWIGSLWFVASTTVLLFGLTTGGTMYAWKSAAVLVSMIGGAISLVGFGWYEVRIAKEPIVKRAIFANWDMIASYLMTMLHGMVLWTLLYFLTLYYQGVKLYTPIISGVAGLPETLSVAPGSALVGFVVAQTGHYRWCLWVGWALTTLGAGILVLLEPDTAVPQWIFLNVPIGIGTGMLFPAMTLSLQAACAPALNADAVAFISFVRNLGQAVGVAVGGVIFQNVLRARLLALEAWQGSAEAYSRDATVVVEVIQAMQPGAARLQLVRAYNDSLHAIWIAMAAIGASSLLLSATVKGYSLKQEHVTTQGFQQKQKGGKAANDVERGDEP